MIYVRNIELERYNAKVEKPCFDFCHARASQGAARPLGTVHAVKYNSLQSTLCTPWAWGWQPPAAIETRRGAQTEASALSTVHCADPAPRHVCAETQTGVWLWGHILYVDYQWIMLT